MKISFLDYENLRKDVRVSKENVKTLETLLEIGKENFHDNGVELLNKVKMIRGLTDEEMSKATGIHIKKLEKILNGEMRISRVIAEKLLVLGFPISAFMRK
jgi:transcription initiation factor IIE alpha subunit